MASVGILVNTSWNIINFRLELIRHLTGLGHRMVVFIPDNEYQTEIESYGVEVIRIHTLSRKGTNPLKDYQLYREYVQAIDRSKVDLALGFTIKPNIYGAMACRKLKIPFLPTITGLGSAFITRSLTTWIAKKLYKHAFRSVPAVFFQNPDDQKSFIDERLVEQSRTFIIPGSGIDTQYFQRDTSRIEQFDIFTFVFVGRLLHDKGIFELLKASKRMDQCGVAFRVLIVGDIDSSNPTSLQKDELEQWEKLSYLQFLGYTNNIKQIMEQAHCVVLPSYREGLPRVILEAMSMSLPVITNDVAGCRSLVTHGENGWLCRAKDSDDLFQKMMDMIKLDPQDRQKMGQIGRERCVLQHDISIINERYAQYISTYLSGITS